MADINVYGTLKSMAEDQKVAYAKQVFDEDLNKDQHTINLELDEKIEGNVEELRDEVLGDEWVDIGYGQREDYVETGSYILPNHNLNSASSLKARRYHVNAGEVWRLEGLGNAPTSASYCWAIYNTYNTSTSAALTLSGYLDGDSSTTAGRNNVEAEITIPSGGAMLIISYLNTNANNVYIYRKSTNPLSIADKTGYKIETWTDDEIIANTALEVGDVVPYWSDGTRYGGRGVRLNVKEGDKILLDTYSPALFGLIFTDENRVIKALYDDRRFDGVWTAPVNGYCYIQDVLYRDNFHYSSAHGHLAYMVHDARKRVAKGGDWYNEYAMRRITQVLPLESTFKRTGSSTNGWVTIFPVDGTSNLTAMNGGQYVLVLFKYYVYEDSDASGSMAVHGSNGIGTTIYTFSGYFIPGTYQYTYRIYRNVTNAGTHFGAYWYNISTEENTHVRFDKVFLHSSSDFAELYQLAQKIINGEVEVDNFYGVREKEVDLVKNAIGLQSISDLGYNILDYGATLPIDEDGYKYAKEIYDRYKDNPPTSRNALENLFINDTKLIYSPYIDCSHTPATLHYYQTFQGCHNLICVPPFDTIPEGTGGSIYCCFDACRSLKRVEGFGDFSIQTIKAAFRNCYSLEYIAKLNTHNLTALSHTSTYGYCYSLERIEELDAYSVNANQGDIFGHSVMLRYCLIKNIGHNANSFTNYISFRNNTLYGVPNDKHPDARQSLVDSLLTYSYDRVNDPDELGTAGTTCTITLSANSYAQLTQSEIEAITAKGYTLTHP